MEPGTERLVSPFFNFSRSDYGFRPEAATLRVPIHFPFLDAEVTSVAIDAVIHSTDPASAWIFGPDVYDLRSQYLATRYAEHDQGVSVLQHLHRLGTTGGLSVAALSTAIDSVLQMHIQIGAPKQGLAMLDRYIRARAQEAAIVRGVLLTGGLEALKADALRRGQFPRDHVDIGNPAPS